MRLSCRSAMAVASALGCAPKYALILAALFVCSAARLPAQALVTRAMPTSPAPDRTPVQQSPPVEGAPLSRSRSSAEATSQPTPQAPENPDHIFLVIPAYRVVYEEHVPPLTPHEKLQEFLESTYDLRGLAFAGAETLLLEHSNTDGFCGYGPGIGGFSKCYGSARLDANVSGFFGDYLFPVWMHQDPRYFRLGRRASVGTRLVYALSRVFITRSEITNQPVFDSSALAGTGLAGALSNLYYPQSDRGVGLTLSRIGIDLLGTATFNLGAEFWEDIKTRVFSQGN